MTVLVDSSVLLDVINQDPIWRGWSEEQLALCAGRSIVAINPVIYAEVSAYFDTIEAVDAALSPMRFQRLALPYEAGFLAAKCFVQYRRRGGQKRSPLADFYIGAHAAMASLTLLTRDAARYRTYFPTVCLIAPGANQK